MRRSLVLCAAAAFARVAAAQGFDNSTTNLQVVGYSRDFIPFDNVLGGRSYARPFSSLLGVRQVEGCTVDCGTLAPGKCCDAGLICCPVRGCCPIGYYCTDLGCCPNGKTCTGIAVCPTDPTQIECAGGGCCPPGVGCVQINSVHSCAASTSVTVPTSTRTTTVTSITASGTTSFSLTSSPSTLTLTSSTTSFSPSTTSSTTNVNAAPTYTPTPGQPAAPPGGAQQISVPNTDPRIIYNPPSAWQSVSENSCTTNTVKRSSTIASKFSFSFNGTSVAVLMSTGPFSGVYDIVIQDLALATERAAVVDANSLTPLSCSTGFATTGLAAGLHTISVSIAGAAADSTTQGTQLDFDSITFSDESQAGDDGGASGNDSPGTGGAVFVPSFARVSVLCGLLTAFFVFLL